MPPKIMATRDASKLDPKPRTIAYQDAIQTLGHDRDMRHALVGVPLPVVFFCLFVAMLSQHIPTSQLYEQAYSVSSVLDSSGTDAITSATTMKFKNIQAIGDIFDWLTDTFVPSVFVTEDYNGKLLMKDKWGRIASFNKVLGAVIFETTRAPIHTCQALEFLVALYPNCYDASNTTTDTMLISFDTNATEATDVITTLKEDGNWLDFSTQQLLVTVVAYNGEVQGYTVTKLQLDLHQGGYIETTSKTIPTISDPYKSKHPAIALDVLVGICLVLSFVRPIVGFYRLLRAPKTWCSSLNQQKIGPALPGFVSSVLTIVFYAIWGSMVRLMKAREFRNNLAQLVVSGKKFNVNSNEREGLMAVTDSLEQVAEMTTALRLVATATVFALGVDILTQFSYHPRLNFLTRTVANALHKFAGFFIVFVVIFVTFAVSGTVLFGDRVEDFSTLSHTMESCVNMLFGNFDYETIKDLEAPVGMIYYWAYMIVVCLVLLNMMLAIVLDSYEEMSQEAASSKYNVSLVRTIKNAVYAYHLRAARYEEKQKARIARYVDKAMSGKRLDVVFKGRIIPDVLEAALLERKFGGTGQEHDEREKVVLTEAMIADLFPESKITPREARATIDFLLQGCVSNGDTAEVEPEVPADPVEVCEPNGVAEAVSAMVHKTDQVEPCTEATQHSQLIARMEALERKLDLLLERAQTQ